MPEPAAADRRGQQQHDVAADEGVRRRLAAIDAADVLADDPQPGLELPLWRGRVFLLAHPSACYDRRRDLWWPATGPGQHARGVYERHVRYGRPLW